MTAPRIRAVIFDLDGTLIDSLEDLADSVNHALAARGLPTHPLASYRNFVGEGQVRLIEKALPPDRQHLRDEVLADFRAHYVGNPVRKTRIYPGMNEVVHAYRARGLALAVLSNKPDVPTQRILSALFTAGTFEVSFGERPGVPRKPDPTSALEIASLLKVAPEGCAFVGDTAIDIHTAHAASMRAIGVTWGFRGREELVSAGAHHLVDSAEGLLGIF